MVHPSAPPNATWLFTRDNESIWVERAESRTMTVTGPARLHVCYEFESDARLLAFQVSLAEQLSSRGWMLHGINADRRQRTRRPSRDGFERRTPLTTALTVVTVPAKRR